MSKRGAIYGKRYSLGWPRPQRVRVEALGPIPGTVIVSRRNKSERVYIAEQTHNFVADYPDKFRAWLVTQMLVEATDDTRR